MEVTQMKNIHIALKGTKTLIMHSCASVNPLHPLAIEMKKITANRKKTEEDLAKLAALEWEAGLYWDNAMGLYMPAENLEACIREGAKARKKGKDIVKGFNVTDMKIPVDIGEKLTLEQMRSDYRFYDTRPMKVKQARVMRTRPRFDVWRLEFDANYDENLLNFNDVVEAAEYAGQYIGLCDSRPKYGTFVATITELD
jgi:hypothetical protein